jgi:hypothetical protein
MTKKPHKIKWERILAGALAALMAGATLYFGAFA